ncbi:MAG TPA: tellurite resistance TerB family protein [Vicinamibacterales bacterium]|nr:tellurite resistance TerB family protein [Vicinamibacterales bacterium]
MIGETTPAEAAGTEALSPPEAFVSLLIASARSDGSVSPHEANQIEHVVSAMKLFRGSSLETRRTMFTTAAERIKEQGTDHVIRGAAATIPKELAATAFAVAVDLMLSDGGLTANEQHFADELRGMLNVDREMAAKIVDVLTIKNAG